MSLHVAGDGTTPDGSKPAASDVATSRFGRLESVSLREYWHDEARDFTPWLAEEENLALLSETIGLNLELVAVEQYVGPFRADIIARDEDIEVIVENQLDTTDHKHLGQLLLYAANRGSQVIVWIARRVTDEHRQAIDWLNEQTQARFYALEIVLWRIGNSPVAPQFNVVCAPNELAREVRSSGGELGPARQQQLAYWTAFTEWLNNQDTPFQDKKPPTGHWLRLRIGTSRGFIALTALRSGQLGVELYLRGATATVVYEALDAQRAAIEAELGDIGELDWQPLPEKTACRIAVYRNIHTLQDETKWPDAFSWMLERAVKFRDAFAERLKEVVVPDTGGVSPALDVSAED
jgi:hypothetical protein